MSQSSIGVSKKIHPKKNWLSLKIKDVEQENAAPFQHETSSESECIILATDSEDDSFNQAHCGRFGNVKKSKKSADGLGFNLSLTSIENLLNESNPNEKLTNSKTFFSQTKSFNESDFNLEADEGDFRTTPEKISSDLFETAKRSENVDINTESDLFSEKDDIQPAQEEKCSNKTEKTEFTPNKELKVKKKPKTKNELSTISNRKTPRKRDQNNLMTMSCDRYRTNLPLGLIPVEWMLKKPKPIRRTKKIDDSLDALMLTPSPENPNPAEANQSADNVNQPSYAFVTDRKRRVFRPNDISKIEGQGKNEKPATRKLFKQKLFSFDSSSDDDKPLESYKTNRDTGQIDENQKINQYERNSGASANRGKSKESGESTNISNIDSSNFEKLEKLCNTENSCDNLTEPSDSIPIKSIDPRRKNKSLENINSKEPSIMSIDIPNLDDSKSNTSIYSLSAREIEIIENEETPPCQKIAEISPGNIPQATEIITITDSNSDSDSDHRSKSIALRSKSNDEVISVSDTLNDHMEKLTVGGSRNSVSTVSTFSNVVAVRCPKPDYRRSACVVRVTPDNSMGSRCNIAEKTFKDAEVNTTNEPVGSSFLNEINMESPVQSQPLKLPENFLENFQSLSVAIQSKNNREINPDRFSILTADNSPETSRYSTFVGQNKNDSSEHSVQIVESEIEVPESNNLSPEMDQVQNEEELQLKEPTLSEVFTNDSSSLHEDVVVITNGSNVDDEVLSPVITSDGENDDRKSESDKFYEVISDSSTSSDEPETLKKRYPNEIVNKSTNTTTSQINSFLANQKPPDDADLTAFMNKHVKIRARRKIYSSFFGESEIEDPMGDSIIPPSIDLPVVTPKNNVISHSPTVVIVAETQSENYIAPETESDNNDGGSDEKNKQRNEILIEINDDSPSKNSFSKINEVKRKSLRAINAVVDNVKKNDDDFFTPPKFANVNTFLDNDKYVFIDQWVTETVRRVQKIRKSQLKRLSSKIDTSISSLSIASKLLDSPEPLETAPNDVQNNDNIEVPARNESIISRDSVRIGLTSADERLLNEIYGTEWKTTVKKANKNDGKDVGKCKTDRPKEKNTENNLPPRYSEFEQNLRPDLNSTHRFVHKKLNFDTPKQNNPPKPVQNPIKKTLVPSKTSRQLEVPLQPKPSKIPTAAKSKPTIGVISVGTKLKVAGKPSQVATMGTVSSGCEFEILTKNRGINNKPKPLNKPQLTTTVKTTTSSDDFDLRNRKKPNAMKVIPEDVMDLIDNENAEEDEAYNSLRDCSISIIIDENENDGRLVNAKKVDPKHDTKRRGLKAVGCLLGSQLDFEFTPYGKVDFLTSLSTYIVDDKCHPIALEYRNKFARNKDVITRNLFQYFNEKVFAKELPEDMELLWSGRLSATAGFCECRMIRKSTGQKIRQCKIVLSAKVLDKAERLRDTLIHEMCHAACYLIDGVSDGHGSYWRAWTRKAIRKLPKLGKITITHQYEVPRKYTYRCTGCSYSFNRQTKSIDVDKVVCGHCQSKFAVIFNGNGKPTAKR